ncbi:MAG: hypothetical protein JSV80_14180 [Acidobacteriota bacterium]|nr:MAG: hypothetical protein JSV80_14180 [Acidobacteriota bacterium]
MSPIVHGVESGRCACVSSTRLRTVLSTLLVSLMLTAAGCATTVRRPIQLDAWGRGDDAELERFLLQAEIVETKRIRTGVTSPKKVLLRRREQTGAAVWKGVDKQYARRDVASERLDDLFFSDKWHYEVAAYRFDRLIGLGCVPVTVIRDVHGEIGSLQAWVDNAISERNRVEKNIELEQPDEYHASLEQRQIFDALIYNVDRTQENILITEPGSKMWLIDHSRAFRLRPQLPGEIVRDPPVISPSLRQRLAELDLETLTAALERLLTRGQIEAILARRDRLLALGR